MIPNLTFNVCGGSYCFLDSSTNFSITLTYDLDHDSAITIKENNTIFDPSAAFSQGMFVVIDAETGKQIHFPPLQQLNDNTTPSSPRLLVLDPKVKDRYLIWETKSSHRTNPKPIPFDPAPLSPGKTYKLYLKAHGIQTWYRGIHTDTYSLPEPESMPIPDLVNHTGFTFRTRQTTPSPPPLDTIVSTSADTVSIKGEPLFKITVRWSLGADNKNIKSTQGVAALRSIPHGRDSVGVEIRDAETGKKRGPVLGWRPPEDGPSPAEEVEVLRFSEDSQVVERSYTLLTDRIQAGTFGTDTRLFRVGHSYLVGVKDGDWAWMTRAEAGEDVWLNDRRLKEALQAEPKVKWKPEINRLVKAVE